MIVYSVDPIKECRREESKVIETHFGRACAKVVTNDVHCTRNQPFYSEERGWTWASSLRCGDLLLSGSGYFIKIEEIAHISEYTEVFHLLVDHPAHAIVTSGLISHNMKNVD